MDVLTKTITFNNTEIEIAFNVHNLKQLFLSVISVEKFLNYNPGQLKEISSSQKFLETFERKLSPKEIKANLEGSSELITLISLEDFVVMCQYEACVNQNISMARLLAFGFGESFTSSLRMAS